MAQLDIPPQTVFGSPVDIRQTNVDNVTHEDKTRARDDHHGHGTNVALNQQKLRRNPSRARSASAKKLEEMTNSNEEDPNDHDGAEADIPKCRKRRLREEWAGPDEPQVSAPKKKRIKIQEAVVYDVKPVQLRSTTFKGRLGYACLNMVLRNLKPDPVFCSRTCRIDTIKKNGLDHVKNLGLQNIRDLYKIVEWNELNKIRFLRISSEMFPFASHSVYGYSLDYADADLQRVGTLAESLGHRLTSHPGQFTQLGSPRESVIESSIRELEYHCEMMDRMKLDQDSVMIIHMGGVFGDKLATLQRFRDNYKTRLTSRIQARLVLENDELCYNLDDLLPICEELGIPLVVDYHHDWINPSSEPISSLYPRINAIWAKKGIKPKQHLSEPRPGATTNMEKRAHADRCQSLPNALPDDMDLMIEAKDKEQAVFHLYRIYQLEDVIHENLRPENEVQELSTKGRKSRSPRKKSAKVVDLCDED